MRILLAPGLHHLIISTIPRVVVPVVVSYATIHFTVARLTSVDSPIWLFFLSLITFHLILTAGTLVHGYNQRRVAARFNAIPVPVVTGRWRLPGNIELIVKMMRGITADYANQWLAEIVVDWGDVINLRILGNDHVFTTNPAYIRQMIVTDFAIWVKGKEHFTDLMHSFLGDGVFNSDGAMWKFHRSMTRPFFAKDKIVHFDIFAHHGDAAIRKIRERASGPTDFQDIAARFTMDSATSFLFGESVNSMAAPLHLPYGVKDSPGTGSEAPSTTTTQSFPEAFQTVLKAAAFRLIVGLDWPLFEFWGDKIKRHIRPIHDYIEPILQRALDEGKEKGTIEGKDVEEGPGYYETLLDHLVSVTSDRNIIRDELLNILLASRDTTAHAITAAMYFLVTEDPDILQSLRKEILDVVGLTDVPNYEQIKDMKYLRAVLNETLRLMPSVPGNKKHSNEASVWTSPETGTRYFIPKGINTSWSVILMQRREDLWGPTALEYDPRRWLDERNKKYYLANPFIFLPFHGGPRMCLGQQFALNEASFFIIRLLQTFQDISFAPDAYAPGMLPPHEWKDSTIGRKAIEKVWPMAHLTTYFKGGLWLRMK
ncbi:hypothetical protein FRB94_010569 [Tulasnella sp. JGI-2019a]|nr:hypothetical protein FRB94_010569 [Tulasnella sp. JGI-2019a]KAG9017879.1 hypothetical protein FRB93_004690 [Tulasnella sp. JGI-2019a]KAG9039097.1 hypothetical protein FRB95_012808 [Tulasnella sp. JGI-2019a]